MSNSTEQGGWYTTAEVAQHLGVDRRTVLRWAKSGAIASRMTPGGHHRIPGTELLRLQSGASAPAPEPQVVATRPPTFLLVDDDRAHSRALARILTRLFDGADVHSATDGFLGGVLAERLRPDVLLLDLVMPGEDGVAVARRLRADPELGGLQIVLITGHHEPPDAASLAEIGVIGPLSKPVSADELRSCLAPLLATAQRGPIPG